MICLYSIAIVFVTQWNFYLLTKPPWGMSLTNSHTLYPFLGLIMCCAVAYVIRMTRDLRWKIRNSEISSFALQIAKKGTMIFTWVYFISTDGSVWEELSYSLCRQTDFSSKFNKVALWLVLNYYPSLFPSLLVLKIVLTLICKVRWCASTNSKGTSHFLNAFCLHYTQFSYVQDRANINFYHENSKYFPYQVLL